MAGRGKHRPATGGGISKVSFRCSFVPSFLNDGGDSDIKKLVSIALHFMEEKKDVISHPGISYYHNEPRLKVDNARMKERNPILVSGKPKSQGG